MAADPPIAAPRPDFFVVGAMKSGTTALFRFLVAHPQAHISAVKEPAYFYYSAGAPRFHGPTTAEPGYRYRPPADGSLRAASVGRLPSWSVQWSSYAALFEREPGERIAGEASTIYLYDPTVAERIARRIRHARILMVLRNPVERAFSQFLHMLRVGRETERDFLCAVGLEPARKARGWGPDWHYLSRSRYRPQVERYLAAFPDRQVKICFHDDLRQRPAALMREVYEFLGIDPAFDPDLGREYNVNRRAWERPDGLRQRFRGAMRRLAGRARSRPRGDMPQLTPRMRRELAPGFESDVRWLEGLTGRDLSAWR
jgi:hypothetical protein